MPRCKRSDLPGLCVLGGAFQAAGGLVSSAKRKQTCAQAVGGIRRAERQSPGSFSGVYRLLPTVRPHEHCRLATEDPAVIWSKSARTFNVLVSAIEISERRPAARMTRKPRCSSFDIFATQV